MILLEVDKLSKAFGGIQAIRQVSFTLEQSEILGLIGPNGSGKSTLFNLITGLIQPDAGKVMFNNRDITGLPPHKICQSGIARTFQLVRPFNRLSPLQNVMVGRAYGSQPAHNTKQARIEAEQILANLGLANKKVRVAETLGMVDRKRLEIARALATRPNLLLLDEMLSGLNPVETEEAIRVIKGIRDSGITLIIVEHVMKVIMGISDRVVVLKAGEKIADGPPQQVGKDSQVIQAYLGKEYK